MQDAVHGACAEPAEGGKLARGELLQPAFSGCLLYTSPLSVYTGIGTTKTYNVDVEDVANVTDVAKDTFYQVNISKKDNTNGEVVILKDVEVLELSLIHISMYSPYSTGPCSRKPCAHWPGRKPVLPGSRP